MAGIKKIDLDDIIDTATRDNTFALIKTMNKKQLDKLRKKNPLKASAGLKSGGRAGFKSGSKGCKLAMKGKGRAYGKNS